MFKRNIVCLPYMMAHFPMFYVCAGYVTSSCVRYINVKLLIDYGPVAEYRAGMEVLVQNPRCSKAGKLPHVIWKLMGLMRSK